MYLWHGICSNRILVKQCVRCLVYFVCQANNTLSKQNLIRQDEWFLIPILVLRVSSEHLKYTYFVIWQFQKDGIKYVIFIMKTTTIWFMNFPLTRLVHNISDPKVLEEYYNSTWNDVWFFVPRPSYEPPFHTIICMVWTPPQKLDKFANMSLNVCIAFFRSLCNLAFIFHSD